MKQIITAILFLLAYSGYAVTYTSINDGDWSDPSSWSPSGVPNLSAWPGDEVHIGHTIDYSGNLTVKNGANLIIAANGQLNVSGKLSIPGGHTGNFLLDSGGRLFCDDFVVASASSSLLIKGYLNCDKLDVKSVATLNVVDGHIEANQFLLSNSAKLNSSDSELNFEEMKISGASVWNDQNSEIFIENDLKSSGSAIINIDGSDFNVLGEAKLTGASVIMVEGTGMLHIDKIKLSGSSYITGNGTAGVLDFSEISISGGAYVGCANNGCNYSAGETPPTPLDLLTGSQALPIELIDFSVKEKNDNVLIEWATATEKNNDYFTIEKSIDRKKWSEVAKVDGQNNANQTTYYSYFDKEKSLARTIYYRLKQTDIGGVSTLSAIQSVIMNQELLELAVYPNPSSDYVNISLGTDFETVNLMAPDGRLLRSESVVNEQQLTWTLYDIEAGIYFIEANSKNAIITKMLVITK